MCGHTQRITTITAGLARQVCESCGHISVHYVENAVQIFPTGDRAGGRIASVEETTRPVSTSEDEAVGGQATPRHQRCKLCAQPAVFMIPEGIMCDEHAWQAAARLSWEDTDPWVPIRIDRSKTQ